MPREFSLEKTRNIGIIAHIDAGKTTVTERILFYTGKKHKMGEVHDGEAEMDWMVQERERGVTITAAATTCFWTLTQINADQISADQRLPAQAGGRNQRESAQVEQYVLNLIDTPGHIDFTAEVQRSLRVLDGAVVVFDGVAGVEPQSETVWHQAEKFSVPTIAFINKMDRLGADFFASLASIHERLTKNARPIQIPIGAESNYQGLIDLLTEKAIVYEDEEGKAIKKTDVPDNLKEEVKKYRHELIEAIVEHDDQLMHQYLEGKEIPLEKLKKVLRKATIQNKIVPVLCGSALKNKGVQPLLDAVCDYLPSPLEVKPVEGINPETNQKEIRKTSDDEPFSALVFKIASDPFAGTLSYFRVYSGKLAAGSYVLNVNSGEKERISRILRMHANKREEVKEVYTGEIAATVGLKSTSTGHTLADPDYPIILEQITFPDPVISIAVEPKTKDDQEKMSLVLSKLVQEDPTFKVKTDEETQQTIISGMGELHLDIITDRMRREFGVEVNSGKPQVAYKETITKKIEIEGKYIHQSGGRGQYGHCWLRLEPKERGKGFEFIDEIKGGIIPREYIPAIKKGVVEALGEGVLAGYPIVDLEVAVYDGSYHEVDSSEIAFKIAAQRAIREGEKNASPVLLEPIMKLEVIVPDKFMGEVIGDLNSKRAKIFDTRTRGEVKIIDAEVPLAEMFGYATSIRSMTEGRGSFTMEFDKYEEVPRNIQEKLLEINKK